MDERDLKTARILIVDDESANVRLLERLLPREGYTNLKSTTDARQEPHVGGLDRKSTRLNSSH